MQRNLNVERIEANVGEIKMTLVKLLPALVESILTLGGNPASETSPLKSSRPR